MRGVRAIAVMFASALLLSCSEDQKGSLDSPLRAKFSADLVQPVTSPSSCPVTAVRFTDESEGDPTEWHWVFGDGTISSQRNPTRGPGAVTAEVTLTVGRGDVEDSVTEMISSHVC